MYLFLFFRPSKEPWPSPRIIPIITKVSIDEEHLARFIEWPVNAHMLLLNHEFLQLIANKII